MSYMPNITSATPKKTFSVGCHTAVLFTDIISAGTIKYHLIMAVFEGESEEPCFAVASEENVLAEEGDGESHFLGVFHGEVHMNLGDSNDWADEAKFSAKALEIITDKFGSASS